MTHFVSSPREKEKTDRRDSIEEMKERDRGERKTNKSDETEALPKTNKSETLSTKHAEEIN